MPHAFKDVEVVRRGDSKGNGMVLTLTTHQGVDIHAIAVPQDTPSGTGPTWTYLLENEGLTLIDAGATDSYQSLVDGLNLIGVHIGDIDRVIITHGHADHDGSVSQVVADGGAEVWAHDIYSYLLPYNPWQVQRQPMSGIHHEMNRIAESNLNGDESRRYRHRNSAYMDSRKRLKVDRKLLRDDEHGAFRFMHAPGHSPDEICVTFDGLVFTGDHVLPEITPHPTTKVRFANEIKEKLPDHYDEDDLYGLGIYLKSLADIVALGPETAVMPAHRLFNNDKFNFQTAERAGEIIDHHASRLKHILGRIDTKPTGLEQITRGIFRHRKLIGGNLYMALSEVVAHVELLQDLGDIELTPENEVVRSGSENHKDFILQLTN